MSIKNRKLSLTLILMMIAATLLIFVPAQAQSGDSLLVTASPGASITNAAPTTSTINVANADTITSMTVTVSITHSHGGDLRIGLRHTASGRSVTLLNGLNLGGYIYGCGADAITAAFNDGAGAAMDNFDCSSDFNMPVTGVYRPSEGLGAFNGVSMAGDWVLEVNDRLPSDNGVLNAWAITFNDAVTGAPAPAPVAGIPVIGGRPAPLCSDFDGSTNPVVRAVFPNGSENVFCRVIQANGEYILSEAEIGSKAVLDHDPIQAVEVYTLNNSQENAYGGQICLEGYAGGILFMDARDAPRVPTWLRSTQNRGYTCTFIPAEGTVVLAQIGFDGQAVDFVPNDDNDATDVDTADTDTSADVSVTSGDLDMGGVALDNCEVITQDILNLRTAPGLNSNVIDLVPFDLTLTATARSGDWLRVIYLDGQGWLNEGYLFTRGNCDG